MSLLASLSKDIAEVLDSDDQTIRYLKFNTPQKNSLIRIYLINRDNLNPFVCEEVLKMKAAGDHKQEKLQILIYIDCLMKMLLAPIKQITLKKFNPCPNFPRIGHTILDNFTLQISNHRTRPISMKDKTICHILVLAAVACHYVLNLENLGKNTKIGIKKLTEIARNLYFTTGKAKNTVELKLPLPARLVPNLGSKKSRR